MKYNPLLLLKIPRIFVNSCAWLNLDATGASVGMGLGMILVTVMPQFTLAQDDATGSRQQVQQTRKDELNLKSEAGMQKSAAMSLSTENDLKSAQPEVVSAVPKFSEKRLSPEELRELRRQLLQMR